MNIRTSFEQLQIEVPADPTALTMWLPIVVSVVAAVIAGWALWRTHFSKGRLIWAPGEANLSITGFDGDEHSWYVPDIAITLSVANSGAQPVVVRGLRIKVRYPGLPIPDAHEFWSLNFELDLDTDLEHGEGRTAIAAKKGKGTPFIVLSKANIDKRFLFWCRWEKPVVQELEFQLEAWTTRQKGWTPVESWSFRISPKSWVYLAEEGGRVSLPAKGQLPAEFYREQVPDDLHKYTGTSEALPSDSGGPGPSYVRGRRDKPGRSVESQ